MNHSTAGFRAIARKSETRSQVITPRVIATIEIKAQAAITSAITTSTERTLKRTRRSSRIDRASRRWRTARVRGMSNATLHTNHGAIEIELFPADAPKTVENFTKLAQDGFYDGVI